MLTEQNVEAELSYAYLHAVAARGGFSCVYSDRHLDAAAVDAVVREDGRKLASDSALTTFELHIQLKATYQPLHEIDGCWSFSLPVQQYDRLRQSGVLIPRLLVVLQLPADAEDWLRHSEDGLIARRCAYWVSLQGAPASDNTTSQTVRVPRKQLLSPAALLDIMTRLSRREVIRYAT
jgi:hypothetical protein